MNGKLKRKKLLESFSKQGLNECCCVPGSCIYTVCNDNIFFQTLNNRIGLLLNNEQEILTFSNNDNEIIKNKTNIYCCNTNIFFVMNSVNNTYIINGYNKNNFLEQFDIKIDTSTKTGCCGNYQYILNSNFLYLYYEDNKLDVNNDFIRKDMLNQCNFFGLFIGDDSLEYFYKGEKVVMDLPFPNDMSKLTLAYNKYLFYLLNVRQVGIYYQLRFVLFIEKNIEEVLFIDNLTSTISTYILTSSIREDYYLYGIGTINAENNTIESKSYKLYYKNNLIDSWTSAYARSSMQVNYDNNIVIIHKNSTYINNNLSNILNDYNIYQNGVQISSFSGSTFSFYQNFIMLETFDFDNITYLDRFVTLYWNNQLVFENFPALREGIHAEVDLGYKNDFFCIINKENDEEYNKRMYNLYYKTIFLGKIDRIISYYNNWDKSNSDYCFVNNFGTIYLYYQSTLLETIVSTNYTILDNNKNYFVIRIDGVITCYYQESKITEDDIIFNNVFLKNDYLLLYNYVQENLLLIFYKGVKILEITYSYTLSNVNVVDDYLVLILYNRKDYINYVFHFGEIIYSETFIYYNNFILLNHKIMLFIEECHCCLIFDPVWGIMKFDTNTFERLA